MPLSAIYPPTQTAPKPTADLAAIESEKLADASRKYEIIKPLLEQTRRTIADVKACADKHQVGSSTIYRWLREFDRIDESRYSFARPEATRGIPSSLNSWNRSSVTLSR